MAECLYFVNSFDVEKLSKLHTKQLLKWEYRDGGWLSCADGCYCESSEECRRCMKNYEQNRTMVKTILATREHIPNKQESRMIRKEKIKKGI